MYKYSPLFTTLFRDLPGLFVYGFAKGRLNGGGGVQVPFRRPPCSPARRWRAFATPTLCPPGWPPSASPPRYTGHSIPLPHTPSA